MTKKLHERKNLAKLERHFGPSLNLEHVIYGKTNMKDIRLKKAKAATLLAMALLSSSEGMPQSVEESLTLLPVVDIVVLDVTDARLSFKAVLAPVDHTVDDELSRVDFELRARLRSPRGQQQEGPIRKKSLEKNRPIPNKIEGSEVDWRKSETPSRKHIDIAYETLSPRARRLYNQALVAYEKETK